VQEARDPWAQLAEDASHSDVAHWRRPRGRKLFINKSCSLLFK